MSSEYTQLRDELYRLERASEEWNKLHRITFRPDIRPEDLYEQNREIRMREIQKKLARTE